MPITFEIENIKTLFKEVGLHSPKGEFYIERVRKHKQVFAYIDQLRAVFNKLSTKRPIVLLDCGCGKSYLSFLLYEYCRTALKREIKIFGVDTNQTLIEQCQKTAETLGFKNMHFHASKVEDFNPDDKVDIIYSLHACDTATDQTIAKGIALQANYIFSVSCCQHTNRKKMSRHPLSAISRHAPYKERLVDMIGDSMRALLLEHFGYGVTVFEFVAAEYTPKNIMLRAIKNTVKKQTQENALKEYQALVDLFHFSPALEKMVNLTSDNESPIQPI